MTQGYETLTCGSCVHFQPPDGDAQTPMGSCWRYPPTPLAVPMQQAPTVLAPADRGKVPAMSGFAVWPIRAPVADDTPACGEYEEPDQGAIGYTEPGATVD